MRCVRFVLFLVSAFILAPAASPASYVIEQASSQPFECDSPQVVCTPDGRTMIAWVVHEEGMWNFDFVYTLLLPTETVPGDPLPEPVPFGPGNRPALCWSREGFTLAFQSSGFILLYQSDLAGVFDPEVFDVISPHSDAFGIRQIDLWGNAGVGAGPHVFMSVDGTLYLPEVVNEVWYNARTEFGWGSFELVASDPTTEGWARMSWETGAYGPWPRVYYLHDVEGFPSLFYRTNDLSGWQDPVPVPGEGGIAPCPIGGPFDVAAWDLDNHAVLGNGLQPTCPCNVIHYIEHLLPGGWSDPEDMTVDHAYYDWPMSPNLAVDPGGLVHAFWFQEGATELLEPRLRNLEYWVRGGGTWFDQGAFLDGQDGPALGHQVAMDVGPGGKPVFAWTRRDTVEGVPQPQAIWIARPEIVAEVSGEEPPAARLALAARPNPFNPRVELAFTLPVSGHTQLAIYDLSGRRVIALHEGELAAGRHRLVWDGRDERGRAQPTGLYLVRVQCGEFSDRCKIVLAR